MTTPVTYVDAAGVHRPSFGSVLDYFTIAYKGIYGADTYLGSDSQDGEFIGVLAAALDDANAMAVSSYNAFSPATGQGAGLSSNVKINGLKRKVPSYSTVAADVVGVALTEIVGGYVADASGNKWSLPSLVQIPLGGVVNEVLTCQTPGAIMVNAGDSLAIQNYTRGWQSVTATAAASPGQPVELDPTLRARQSQSTSQAAQTTLDGVVGAVLALPNVTGCTGYENKTLLTDADGVPAGAISLVVSGGDPNAIANVIGAKTLGVPTYGNTKGTYTDAYGIEHAVSFFIPIPVEIYWSVILIPIAGYTNDVGVQIAAALSDWTNGLGVGESVVINRAYVPANLDGTAKGRTYKIKSVSAGIANGSLSASDIPIAFNKQALCQVVTAINGALSYPNVTIKTSLA